MITYLFKFCLYHFTRKTFINSSNAYLRRVESRANKCIMCPLSISMKTIRTLKCLITIYRVNRIELSNFISKKAFFKNQASNLVVLYIQPMSSPPNAPKKYIYIFSMLLNVLCMFAWLKSRYQVHF